MQKVWGGVYIGLSVAVLLYNTIIRDVVFKIGIVERMIDGSNKLVPFLLSISIVCFAQQKENIFKGEKVNKGITTIAKSSLIIYIVHCNKYFIKYVFPAIRNIWEKTSLPYIVYIVVVSTILIMVLTFINTIVDFLKTFKKVT